MSMCRYVTFATELGWFALLVSPEGVRALTFGHQTQTAVQEIVDQWDAPAMKLSPKSWLAEAVCKLQQFAAGEPVDLSTIPLDRGPLTDFQQQVFHRVCAVEYGERISYGELATEAGYPGAARAVGTFMARNPIPLLIPCHRVLGAHGRLGGYSAPQGLSMKQRLLDMEAAHRAVHIGS